MTRQSAAILPGWILAVLFFVLLILPGSSARGQDVVGSFLAIPVDVVGEGFGGANVARFSQGVSPFANPAGAVVLETQVGLTHGIWLAEQSVSALNIQLPTMGGRGGLAVLGRMVNHATVPRFDQGGQRLGSLNPQDLSVGMAYAMRFGRVSLGAGTHYVQENLEVAKGTGFAYDLGVLLDMGPLRLGAAGINLFGTLDYDGEKYEIPETVSVGASYRPSWRNLELTALFHDRRFGDQDLALGMQWTGLNGVLSLRGGYVALTQSSADKSFAPYRFGFTIAHSSLALDYAYVPHEELGQAHLLALRWGAR